MSDGEMMAPDHLSPGAQELIEKDYVMLETDGKTVAIGSECQDKALRTMWLGTTAVTMALLGFNSGVLLFGFLSILLSVMGVSGLFVGIAKMFAWKGETVAAARTLLSLPSTDSPDSRNNISREASIDAIKNGRGTIAETVSTTADGKAVVEAVQYVDGKSIHTTQTYIPASTAWAASFKKTLELD